MDGRNEISDNNPNFITFQAQAVLLNSILSSYMPGFYHRNIKMEETIIENLRQIEANYPQNKETAAYWIETIIEKQAFLSNRKHPVVFIGDVGVGKTSIIATLANLFVGGKAYKKKDLKQNSILSIGSGRTTICEVQIHSSDDEKNEPLKLYIEPLSPEEMEKEIIIYAEMEWNRYHPDKKSSGKDEAETTPIEMQRAIRNMTDYAEYHIKDGKRNHQRAYPIKKAISQYDTVEDFARHLIERSQINKRTQTEWQWNTSTFDHLKDLKAHFENINQGKEKTAMLPKRMTVKIPSSFLNKNSEFQQILIDTRGLDGPVETRDDLYEYIKDPHALIVLCASFNDAPGERLREIINQIKNNALLNQALNRTIMLLVDQDDAEQVNGADGQRELGQDIKIDECQRSLESIGLDTLLKDRMISFDVLNDDIARLISFIQHYLKQIHQDAITEKDILINNIQQFIKTISDKFRPQLCRQIDDRIKEVMKQTPLPTSAPLDSPLTGIYIAIDITQPASIVYASCRRNGVYYNLNLYAAAENWASFQTTRWFAPLIKKIEDRLDDLEKDQSLTGIKDHICLRREQFKKALVVVVSDYAKRLKDQIYNYLVDHDNLWRKCSNEWGRGPGFKIRVKQNLKNWESKQQKINAHEIIHTKEIPLLAEVLSPALSYFRLHVRNLRALRQIDWAPDGLNVLIGGNGTGKTTLLLTFKLLKIAYERDLPEAITQVFGGNYRLKSIGIDESDPIKIGLEINEEISWKLEIFSGAGNDYQTKEELKHKNRILFSRNTQGNFIFNGIQIDSGSKLGIRSLMDRGEYEPALRQLALFILSISVYHDPDLWGLRNQGSNTTESRKFHSRSKNALTLMRQWQQELPNQFRFQFVLNGLRAAFPNVVQNLDFEEAGNTLIARTYPPDNELSIPLRNEANGVLQLLVLLSNVASTEKKGLIAIDEPENSLHPYALRVFLHLAQQWAKKYQVTIILATHSPSILDELTGSPEKVYIMKTNLSKDTQPVRLDNLRDREWLEEFEYGDLYEQGEIGSNEDEN